MAKSKANTDAAPPAPQPTDGQRESGSAAPEAAQPAPATAAVRRSVKPADDNSEQEALDGLLKMADVLAGVDVIDEPESAKPKTRAAAKPAPPDADDDTDAAPLADEDDERAADEDGPIIPETDEEQDEDDAADGAEDTERSGLTPDQIVKKLDTKLFKKRQQVRDLTAQLEAKSASEKALAEKLAKVEALPQGGVLDLGPFSGARSEEDIARLDGELQSRIDWCEDNEDGYEGQDKDGNPVSYTKQEIRQWRRNYANARPLAEKARNTLKVARESEATARKRYPFVFDPSKPLYQKVLDAAAETPGINNLPNKALVLGRLAMAKLIESGDYMLVRKGAAKPAAAAPAAKPKHPAPPAPPSTSRQSASDESDLHRRIASGDKKALEEWAESLIPA